MVRCTGYADAAVASEDLDFSANEPMQIWLGTSGYSYPDWVGKFYPPGTSRGRMLSYYCRQFPIVELNFTFYRPPTPEMLIKIAEHTPSDFQFVVKLPRSLSHEQKTDDLPLFRESAEALRSRGQLKGLLCQLPQRTHYAPQNLAWIERLSSDLGSFSLAVEFRHRSWFDLEVTRWLADRKLDVVSVDAPELPDLFPSGPVRSGPNLYVRFHSRNRRNWYQSDKERYDYRFSDNELLEWIDHLRDNAADSEKALVLFNNCHNGSAAVNAVRMKELFASAAPELKLVEPPADRGEQGLLFE